MSGVEIRKMTDEELLEQRILQTGRGTQDKPLLFAEGERPPLGPEHYDHVHIGDRCRKNRFPACGYKVGEPPAAVCTACQLAKMLEGGVMSVSIEAGHSDCEGTREQPCSCGCEYSLMHQCKECGRKGTELDNHGQCANRRDCANAIVAAIATRTAERKARQATAPPKKSGGRAASSPRSCNCGCGEMTNGGMYRPGHDARHVSRLVAEVKAGSKSQAAAESEIDHSEKLIAKFRKAVA